MVNLVKLSPQKQKFENVFSYPFLWKVGLTHIKLNSVPNLLGGVQLNKMEDSKWIKIE